jgi:WD40 repeat protein
MIPENRLGVLFDHIKERWISDCQFHNTFESPSLLYDHTCKADNLPVNRYKELTDHRDEVWFLAFSHDGRYLATGGQDQIICIYDTSKDFEKINQMNDHYAGVSFLAWSPDNTKLLSCTREKENKLRVFDDVTLPNVCCSQ